MESSDAMETAPLARVNPYAQRRSKPLETLHHHDVPGDTPDDSSPNPQQQYNDTFTLTHGDIEENYFDDELPPDEIFDQEVYFEQALANVSEGAATTASEDFDQEVYFEQALANANEGAAINAAEASLDHKTPMTSYNDDDMEIDETAVEEASVRETFSRGRKQQDLYSFERCVLMSIRCPS